MDKINAVITGVGGYVPEDVLSNEDISKLVDTTDEWMHDACWHQRTPNFER